MKTRRQSPVLGGSVPDPEGLLQFMGKERVGRLREAER
jgi:hypothetical protein